MDKKRVSCPDCGHRFTIKSGDNKIRTVGVRSKRITKNQFEYTITAPEAMEGAHISTVIDDLILSGALALPAGAICGLMASIVAPDYALQIIGIGTSTGVGLAWGWLCAEHNQRLKRILPWALEQKESWTMGKHLAEETAVTLTVDTRNEYDGFTSRYFGSMPVDVQQFNRWAIAILDGESMAINKWTGPGKFNRTSEYEPLLAHMCRAGVAVNQPGKGHSLTGAGHRALRQHLKAHPPAPLQEYAQ